MVAFRKALGSQGQYYVVPVLGALAAWLTFALGRWLTGSSAVGLSAALVLAVSPPFLAALMWPMSDVPVTAAWTLAFLLALRGSPRASAASGIVASVAILIRPNLVPVAGIIAISLLWRSVCDHGPSRRALLSPLAFVSGVLPGIAAVAALNTDLYGSPFRSGYSSVNRIYTPAYLAINAPRYTRWILTSRSAYVLLGVGAMLLHWPRTIRVPHRAPARFLVAGVVFVIWLSYMLWVPQAEHDWPFLRVLLPLWPISIVFAAALAADVLARLRVPGVSGALVAIAVVVGLTGYLATKRYGAFEPRPAESRYARTAAYVSAHTPAKAVIFSMQHSGSLRYYAGRVTVRYDFLDPAWLDRGAAAVSKLGYPTFILLDTWEEPEFRRRFAATSELGRLDWAGVEVVPGVRLYDTSRRFGAPR
jgi:hypothetical protein